VVDVPANPSPARIINLSLGSAASCSTSTSNAKAGTAQLYRNAIKALADRNVVVVAAAGNDELAVNFPGNCPGVITVGGLRHTGTKSGFSSLGNEVTLSAPAGNCVRNDTCLYPILSTTNAGPQTPFLYTLSGDYTTGDYKIASLGTSFSAPLVSATAALLLSQNPNLTAAQVRALLRRTTTPFPTSAASLSACTVPDKAVQDECICTTATCGTGMLSTGKALQALVSRLPLADIQTSALNVLSNQTVQLDASGSWAGSGRTLRTDSDYASWSITNGAGIAALTSGVAGQAELSFNGGGTVKVRLTVTNSAGDTASVDQEISVTGVNSGGGGALAGGFGLLWLAGLVLAVLALARVRAGGRH
jgi:serine protease